MKLICFAAFLRSSEKAIRKEGKFETGFLQKRVPRAIREKWNTKMLAHKTFNCSRAFWQRNGIAGQLVRAVVRV